MDWLDLFLLLLYMLYVDKEPEDILWTFPKEFSGSQSSVPPLTTAIYWNRSGKKPCLPCMQMNTGRI